jgi:regulator of replication initiation timing
MKLSAGAMDQEILKERDEYRAETEALNQDNQEIQELLKESDERTEALNQETQELVAETDALNQENQEIRERLKASDEFLAQAEASYQLILEETERQTSRLRMLVLLHSGKYYAPIESIWISGIASYNDERLFEALRREQAPTATERLQSVRRPSSYTVSLQKSIPTRFRWAAADDSSSLDVETEHAMFPTDILGTPYFGHMMHLIPVTYERASVYSDVVKCVLALGDDARNDIQLAIHGTRLALRGARTGIKHSPLNLTRIQGRGDFFEEYSSVIIVPIMTLDQMKAWNLEGYEAIVLAGEFENGWAAHAYRGMGMNQPQTLTLATHDEIEKSRESLQQVVQGLAYSLAHRSSQRCEDFLEPAMRHQLESFRTNLQRAGSVIVPKATSEGYSNLRVGKVSFQAHSPEAGAVLTHPAPDPLLLVIKSAINWSRLNGQQLLVTGEGSEEEEVEYDDYDDEEY